MLLEKNENKQKETGLFQSLETNTLVGLLSTSHPRGSIRLFYVTLVVLLTNCYT